MPSDSSGSNTLKIVGVVNITEDSFSDGGRYLDPSAAIARSLELANHGADWVELGAASSHPDSADVSSDQEIARLTPVLEALRVEGIPVAVDTWKVETQRFCLQQRVRAINDIEGFASPELYPALRDSDCGMVVMHSVQGRGRATRVEIAENTIMNRIETFFEGRLAQLTGAGIDADRFVLDPGMGFFLGASAAPSVTVLREFPQLRKRFGNPIMIAVSRKSFLGELTGSGVHDRAAASLAAELSAAARGADYIRTHDVMPLRDALRVTAAIDAQ